MTDTFTLSPRRTISSLGALLVAIALVAMLALGFGIRAWTEDSPRPAAPSPAVRQAGPDSAAPLCRIGKPC